MRISDWFKVQNIAYAIAVLGLCGIGNTLLFFQSWFSILFYFGTLTVLCIWVWHSGMAQSIGKMIQPVYQEFLNNMQKWKKAWEDQMAAWEAEAAARRQKEEEARKAAEAAVKQKKWEDQQRWIERTGISVEVNKAPKFATYQISVPKTTIWSNASIIGLIRSLSNRYSKEETTDIFLGIVATHESIVWTIRGKDDKHVFTRDEIENLVHPFFPDAQIAEYHYPLPAFPIHRQSAYYTSKHRTAWYDYAPSVKDFRDDNDPIKGVVQAMTMLRKGEVLRFDLMIPGVFKASPQDLEAELMIDAYTAGERYRITSFYRKDIFDLLTEQSIVWMKNQGLKQHLVPRWPEQQFINYLRRLEQPLIGVFISLTFDTPDISRQNIVDGLSQLVMQSFSGREVNIVEAEVFSSTEYTDYLTWAFNHPFVRMTNKVAAIKEKQGEDAAMQYMQQCSFFRIAEEVAAMWHLPHEKFAPSKIAWAVPQLPSELTLNDSKDRIVLGTAQGKQASVLTADLRHHVFMTGSTGTGKSNQLQNIAHQLIEGNSGFAVFDPHGSLVQNIVSASVLVGKTDKILLLDLNKTDYPIPLNPFRVPAGADKDFAYDLALWVMKSVFKDSWSMSLMETVVTNTLELVLTDPEATPLDMQRVLTNNYYRQRLLKQALKQGAIEPASEVWWTEEFGKGSDSGRREASQSTRNRLRVFLNSRIEQMVCHPQSLDFRKLIAEGYILLINLHGSRIQSEIGNLGAILFAQLFLNSKSLGVHPSEQPPRYYILLDETHRFITTQIDEMFSEARKFGLSLILSDQWIGQLPKDTQAAIVNNRGTAISFAGSPHEAKAMSTLYEPTITAQDIVNQDIGQAAIRTRFNGKFMPAFQVMTQPPLPPIGDKKLQVTWDELWKHTVSTLDLMSGDEVRAWIRTRYKSKAASDSNTTPSDNGAATTDIEYGSSDDEEE
jgi:hypothetical protein